MSMILTLIAGGAGRLALAEAANAIACEFPVPAALVWLAPGEACEIDLGEAPVAAALPTARGIIGDAAIDVVVQPAGDRRRRLLVADMESTIIENEMLDELADFLGLRAEVAAITWRAMNGEIDFVAALEARVALLRGLPESVLAEAAERIRLMPGAQALVATMRRHGAVTALVSGGFRVFAEQVAAGLGFDRVVANRLDIVDGAIAGTVALPLVTSATKRDTLLSLSAELGLAPDEALAVGDGANDLPMLREAGMGVAFRAKPAVAEAARFRIDHGDLTALLYAQGYREDEIVR